MATSWYTILITMKRLRGFLGLILLLPLILQPAQVFALVPVTSSVMIVEIQTTGTGGIADQEFIEIYNPTDRVIDVSSWKMQYLSAGGSTWATKATLNGLLAPQGTMLVASSAYLDIVADVTYNSGLKLEAGHVRIVSPDPSDITKDIVEDTIGWGTALHPEGKAAVFAPAGSSLVRKIDETGKYQDTNDNSIDFEISDQPTPKSNNVSPEVVENEEKIDDQILIVDDKAETNEVFYNQIEITELLPNPAPPATDANDEFVELHNTSGQDINLDGFKIQTGNSFSYSFEVNDKVLPANGYLVLLSGETGLVLSNSSGKARIISPSGNVLSETAAYANAKDGESWALIDGAWQWTGLPTSGTLNVLFVPEIAAPSASSAVKKMTVKKPKATKKPAVKKKTAAKPKEVKAKKDKKNIAATTAGVVNNGDGGGGSSPIHKWVIAVVGLLALGYALYEYKDDIASRIQKLRRNRTNRRIPRTSP